ncbi:glycoside hydrolase 3 protein [Emydomyces testavorans]|uniref:glucan 1,3-beta-glucosidase n=1 Tax=Emydomyces testavorans TaxID=2070801 RepID=A0AAF0DCC6_9EURO|nr:glycoside hydrolase 3 protein [Emydomyces testavorans]
MRFSTLVPLALAAAPVVSAAGKLGFALGVKNADGSCKSQADFEKDFDVLKAHSTTVRTYAAADCNNAEAIVPAAKKKGFKLILGVCRPECDPNRTKTLVRPDVPESFNADTKALQKVVPGNEDVITAITVGSETLYRGNFTGQTLLEKINQVQRMFPKVQVGTADSWNKYADGTADPLIAGGVKYLLVNAFAFWQGQDIGNATATYFDDMMQAISHIQKVAGKDADKIYIATGETGWPTDGGTSYGAAKASTENAKTFHEKGVCGMLAWGVDVFYFEAFDEPWKPKSVGDNGKAADETHWGMYTAERQPKYKVEC